MYVSILLLATVLAWVPGSKQDAHKFFFFRGIIVGFTLEFEMFKCEK